MQTIILKVTTLYGQGTALTADRPLISQVLLSEGVLTFLRVLISNQDQWFPDTQQPVTRDTTRCRIGY